VQQPLHLSATWIALEDVVEGRGELVYLEGSHRIPHQIFKDGVKWFNLERDDAAAAIRYVEEESAKLRCPKKSFLAKKGDVFLWAADLVHGSATRTRPDHETRLSCVTHYVPKTAQPLWFMFSPDRRGLEPWGERAWLASSHYELPRTTSGLLTPTLKLPLPC
jgi:ectoine hydroxylase-related dioxygenase (phytanoyl-CoA dioxygenase family)